ncbi:hypothetical protein A4X09_0g4192 [Tilletia walkeri]|uniref:SURF1-like protein n=1 Tax=Tilletia walkeri TaxID=117179 RepID=A0A8X7N7X7_9BASI|nr:hypothetical protein A4X09_0g4192 [Tilletia walkeri]
MNRTVAARTTATLTRNTQPSRPALIPAAASRSQQQQQQQQRALYHGDLSSSEYQGQGARKPDTSAHKPWYTSPTTLVLGFIPIFTAGLGLWQLQRLKWKVSLIEELEDKLRKDPIVLPKNINLEALSSFEFRLVQLEGSFDTDPSRTLFLGPRVKDGILGYQVVVPFHRSTGGADVLLNRGFIAETQTVGKGNERRLRNPKALGSAGAGNGTGSGSGSTKVLAILPRIYPANAFTPPNEPTTNSWFHADPEQMARYLSPITSTPDHDDGEDHYTPSAGVASSVSSMLGLSSTTTKTPVLPILLEEIFEGNAGEASNRVSNGLPLGRAPTIELRNQHAVYAATWFSLSAATAGMFAVLVRRGR